SWSPPLPCLAADTYLDRSKVREAVPYGTSLARRGSHEGTTAAESEGDRSHQTGPSGVTSTTIGRESTEGGRGGGTDQPRWSLTTTSVRPEHLRPDPPPIARRRRFARHARGARPAGAGCRMGAPDAVAAPC